MTYTKPLLKWVGGKTQIIETVINSFPKEFNDYHEIFTGGGSVLLALLDSIDSGKIKVKGVVNSYDLNESLIYLYENIQSSPNEFYETVEKIIKEFNSCQNENINRKPKNLTEALENKENYYYWIRNIYNNYLDKKEIYSSALFLFLNKTCFRGMYRTGPNGFNVPYGNYKKPEILNKAHLDKISKLIKNVNFEVLPFEKSINKAKPEDFIYLDPPYAPIDKNSFVGYTKDGFSLESNQLLFDLIKSKEVPFVMSNADVEFVRFNFPEGKFEISSISCKRSINSKNPGSKVQELLIKYPLV